MSIYADAKYTEVSNETKQALFDEVKADMRYEHQLYGCYECGIKTIPTMIIYRGEDECERMVGLPKKKDLKESLKLYLD